jgi:hypothetical protein
MWFSVPPRVFWIVPKTGHGSYIASSNMILNTQLERICLWLILRRYPSSSLEVIEAIKTQAVSRWLPIAAARVQTRV